MRWALLRVGRPKQQQQEEEEDARNAISAGGAAAEAAPARVLLNYNADDAVLDALPARLAIADNWRQTKMAIPSRFNDLIGDLGAQSYNDLVEAFSSSLMHSCNLSHLQHIARTIHQVARIDRLPDANSFEGLQVLMRAWEKVDIFTHVSRRCSLSTDECSHAHAV